MPRPYKDWLDYFPLDTDFFFNKKIKDLRRKKGKDGLLTYLNLLCKIYRNGYYCTFEDLEEFSRDIAEEITDVQLDRTSTKVAEVINYLVGRGILDEGLFKQNVITGVPMQEQYIISMYKAKRKINMDVHLLVDVCAVIAKIKKNSEDSQVNSEENQVNSKESTQNKGNENNPNQNSTNQEKAGEIKPNADSRFQVLYDAYPRKGRFAEAGSIFEALDPSEEQFSLMLKALEIQKKSDSWKESDGKFIPGLVKWLSEHLWEDAKILDAVKSEEEWEKILESNRRNYALMMRKD